jgi:enoyl-CoA hydratase
MTTAGLVRVDDAGAGVRLLTLVDPDRRNAMNAQMGAELREAVATMRHDGTRALVVTGAPPAFCAGADLPELFGDPGRPVSAVHDGLQRYYRAFLDVADAPFPTVAAVNGPAVGAGLNLALACDVRIAGPDASFGATFAKIGLHPGGGCTYFLVRAIGRSRALQTLLLGATLGADQAVEWGLAEGPEERPLEVAVELASRFADLEPELAASIKRGVGIATQTGDRDAVLEFESWAQAASASSPRLQEWVARFRPAADPPSPDAP